MKQIKKISDIKFSLDLEKIEKKSVDNSCPYTLDRIQSSEFIQTFKTKFQFLKAHRGLQKSCIHLLLGRSNKGKSTLLQSIVCESLIHNHKVLLFLSEGEKGDVRRFMESILSLKYKSIVEREKIMSNLLLIDNDDMNTFPYHDENSWLNSMFSLIKKYEVELLYIDNLSTCTYADSTPEIQSNFFRTLCHKASSHMIPVFCAIHQSKSVSDEKPLILEDIRGNSAFMNSAQFIYAIQNFKNLDNTKRIVEILKSRKNGEIVGKTYEIIYKKAKTEGFYSKDIEIERFQYENICFHNKTTKIQPKRYQNR